MQKLLVVLFLSSTLAFAKPPTVHHPKPRKPFFLAEDLYPALKSTVRQPPGIGSAAQADDEKTLLELQRMRTKHDCAVAKGEIFINMDVFYGKPRGPLTKQKLKQLTPFLLQAINDADFFVQKLKKDFPRQRPFVYMKKINPCVAREVTLSYPSGHAVISKLTALILEDLYPNDRELLEARAAEIGRHRVMVGMHHPSDIETGREVAAFLYEELKRSPKFQAEFSRLKP